MSRARKVGGEDLCNPLEVEAERKERKERKERPQQVFATELEPRLGDWIWKRKK